MNTSPISMGWLLAMFDLPVMTDRERRIATRFRNDLLDQGFQMMQYSVYFRPFVHLTQQHKVAEQIRRIAPTGGNIRLIFITDQQWINSIPIIGTRRPEDEAEHPNTRRDGHVKNAKVPEQIEFWE